MFLRNISIDQGGVATIQTQNEVFQCDGAGNWTTSSPPAAIKTEIRNALKGVDKAVAVKRRSPRK